MYPYTFNPDACKDCPGRCCNGASGYIFVTPTESEQIAKFLGLNLKDFSDRYLEDVSQRVSIREVREGDNFACIFFDKKKNGCSIYSVRPQQCRTFPFWERFKRHTDEILAECPGVIPL